MTFRLKQIVGVVLWVTLAITLGFVAATSPSYVALFALAVACALLAAMLAFDILRGPNK